MFGYVSNPYRSRRPKQNFVVQIKGTHDYTESDEFISYSLKSLAFPAYIAYEVTADLGIIFIVLNPDIRGGKRIFWKYMSPSFIKTINFEQSHLKIIAIIVNIIPIPLPNKLPIKCAVIGT